LRSEQAIKSIIDNFDILFQDYRALSELGKVLGMIGPKAVKPLTEYLRQPDKNEISYVLVMDSLYEIASAFPECRDIVLAIYQDYMRAPWEYAYILNGLLMGRLVDLGAKETITEIRNLFALDFIDASCAGDLEDIEILLGFRSKRSKPKEFSKLQQPLSPLESQKSIERDDGSEGDEDLYNTVEHWLMLHETGDSILNVSELDGYLVAIACAPEIISPSIWIPEVWGGVGLAPIWESESDIQQFDQAVFSLYDRVKIDLNDGNYEPAYLENTKNVKALPIVESWCEGFIRGLGLWPTVKPEDRPYLTICIVPMQTFGTDQGIQSLDSKQVREIATLQQDIAANVSKLYHHFFKPKNANDSVFAKSR
jgi:uncharacterized protein